MKRRRSDDCVDVVEELSPLELDTAIVLFVGRLGVDTDRLVAARAEHRHEAAKRAAANLDDARRWSG
jgi:hypothetical protein